jgi:hypothetical protein
LRWRDEGVLPIRPLFRTAALGTLVVRFHF